MTDLVTIYIDDVAYQVPKGANLVDAAKMVGNDVPVFCYHPKLAPVGMCRMCLVELGNVQYDKDTKQMQVDDKGQPVIRWQPKLATACTTTVAEGLTMRTATKQVTEARDDIIEFLLTSHPLDCPICDKGGECPLQNLTLRHGPGTSRFVYDEKMHLDKHVPLGDLIYLDRERCIQCARCTRFQDELVGDPVLGFHERGRRLQIVTTSNPPFDTYFSGNTTDICPVGALTTADFRFGARPWELTEVPSICPHCPVGCNISLTTRPDRDAGGQTIVKRVMPRQNEQVNEIWICDKGRFGHHHSRSNERLTTPLIRKNGKLVEATWAEALNLFAQKLNENKDSVAAIAGPMVANEDLWELRRLVSANDKLGVWPYNVGGAEYVQQVGVATGTNFKDLGRGSTVVVVATDLEETAPVWYLRVKAAHDRGARLITVNARTTKLDRFVFKKADKVRYPYGGEAAALDGIDLGDAQNVIILVGTEGLDRAGHTALMRSAAAKLIAAGKAGKVGSGLIGVWPGANTQGAFDLGYTSTATETILAKRPDMLILVDADPVGEDALSQHLLEPGFNVVVDLFLTKSAEQADLVLPRQSVPERDGTFTNGERRVQRFYTAQSPVAGTRPDWKIFGEVAQAMGKGKAKLSAAAVMQEVVKSVPAYADMTYPNLAKVEAQFPDVGGLDLYYGGTAYDNHGGLGLQWPVIAQKDAVSTPAPVSAAPLAHKDGELLVVPITELYNRESAFYASRDLMGEHIPAPYVVLNPADAAKLGVEDGNKISVGFDLTAIEAQVRVDAEAPAGALLLPRYLAANPVPMVPQAGCTIQKLEVTADVSR
jgi:NADH-quinone oxidoreductase subunit G